MISATASDMLPLTRPGEQARPAIRARITLGLVSFTVVVRKADRTTGILISWNVRVCLECEASTQAKQNNPETSMVIQSINNFFERRF